MTFEIRLASRTDLPVLTDLIQRSARELQRNEYSEAQIEGALAGVFGADSQLVADGTYFVVQNESGSIVGCGGWSKRKTLFGGDHWSGRQDALLDPATDPAKIRAFFIHPQWSRRGIASLILKTCEDRAAAAGFRKLEMGATLTGVPLYAAHGYAPTNRIEVPLPNGQVLPVVQMEKTLP